MSDDTNIPSGPPDPEVFSSLSEDILRKARQLGASDADLGVVVALSLEVGVRAGTLETVERSEARDLGLRLFFWSASGLCFYLRHDSLRSSCSC